MGWWLRVGATGVELVSAVELPIRLTVDLSVALVGLSTTVVPTALIAVPVTLVAISVHVALIDIITGTSPVAGVAVAHVVAAVAVAGERGFVGVTTMLPGLTTALLTLCSSNSAGAACCALMFSPGVTVDSCPQVSSFVDIL